MAVLVTVGNRSGDMIGNTHRVLQAAVHYVAALGGGTVQLLEGEFWMYDAVRLGNGVSLAGDPGNRAVLRKADGAQSRLKATSGYGDSTIVLQDPSGFKVGYGVTVFDRASQGFLYTVGTIVAQLAEDTFQLNTTMNMDMMVEREATAMTAYPIVAAEHCERVSVSNLDIWGNKQANGYIDGCRGGGIWLHRVRDAVIRNCRVYDYNGDGISYQNSHDVGVSDCVSNGNAGYGFHPGSGSKRTVVRDCAAAENGMEGFYFCWKVTDGLVERCEFSRNQGAGISIGHQDTDNRIVNSRIADNARSGIEFRREDAVHAPHRTRIEGNTILDNGTDAGRCGIEIAGEVRDVSVVDNRIGNRDGTAGGTGVRIGVSAGGVAVEGNVFTNVAAHIVRERCKEVES